MNQPETQILGWKMCLLTNCYEAKYNMSIYKLVLTYSTSSNNYLFFPPPRGDFISKIWQH